MEFALWPPAYNELADAQRFYRELAIEYAGVHYFIEQRGLFDDFSAVKYALAPLMTKRMSA